MSNFFPDVEKTVGIDDEHTVTVKKLTYADGAAATGAAAHKAAGSMDAAAVFMRFEVVKRSVIAWSGPELDDVPCTPENIARLDMGIANKMADAAWEFNNSTGEDDDEDGDTEKKE